MLEKPINTMTKLADVVEPESNTRKDTGLRIRATGALVFRYGLVLVIGGIGLMKFTGYEAKGIEPLVAHSPFMGWMYGFLSVQAFSDVLGVVEVAIAILIGLRHWSAKASALGSALAVIMFLTTLSFLCSTPGWEPSLGGFPSLSALPGQFLLKDVVLLGAARFGRLVRRGRAAGRSGQPKGLRGDCVRAVRAGREINLALLVKPSI
jgi:uncharacterized membrane protein YkgB